MPTPQATVLLPLYESHDIAWLAIESLCRQKTKYKWELIVAEEQRRNKCGEAYFDEYLERLEKAGMVHFVYLPLTKKIYLSEKWRMMSWLIAGTSKVSLLQAADCYSEPKRIQTAVDAVNKGFDWIQSPKGPFYHIGADKTVLYDSATIRHRTKFKTHLNMALRSDLMRHICYLQKKKGVDGYLYSEIAKAKKRLEKAPLRVHLDKTENWKNGVDTHGFNHISKRRGGKIEAVSYTFVETTLTIDKILPKEISVRLKQLGAKLKKAA